MRFESLVPFIVCCGCLMGCAQVDLAATLSNDVCSDDFDRPHSPVPGGNWENLTTYAQTPAPHARIDGNRLHMYAPYPGSAKTMGILCKDRVNQPNVKLSVQIMPLEQNITSDHKILLVQRFQDTLNNYSCGFDRGKIEMKLAVNGENIIFGQSFSITFLTQNIPAELIFDTRGAALACTLSHNGVTATLNAVDSTYLSGFVALYTESTLSAIGFHADNFNVEIRR